MYTFHDPKQNEGGNCKEENHRKIHLATSMSAMERSGCYETFGIGLVVDYRRWQIFIPFVCIYVSDNHGCQLYESKKTK